MLLVVALLLLALVFLYVSYVRIPDPNGNYAQSPLLPGTPASVLTPSAVLAQRHASRHQIDERGKQILFGDTHVHTTWSFDAFMFSLPVLNASMGSSPPAAACDYARYVSQLDFFFLTDHAESYTSQRWRDAQQAVRHCNALAGDADNPDLVAFMGFEWSQFGKTPDTHYGHHNVLFRDIEQDKLPARAIGAAGPASDALRGSDGGHAAVVGSGQSRLLPGTHNLYARVGRGTELCQRHS